MTEQMDITKMNKIELLKLCKELGISKYSSKNKSQLIELIHSSHKLCNDNDNTENLQTTISLFKGGLFD